MRGDKVRDFVFEEECVNILTIAIDNDQTSITNIVQDANPDQDHVEEPPFKIKKLLQKNKLYSLKNQCH